MPRSFDEVYRDRILSQAFCEAPEYYLQQRPRYRRTLSLIDRLDLPSSPRVLEVGGGQLALLMQAMRGARPMVLDLSERWSGAVTTHGIDFRVGDLVRDDPGFQDEFDLVVLCEVIEHMPIPGHLVIERIAGWLKPSGLLFMTTPNLYRLRNVVRVAMGMSIFCPFRIPPRGSGIGHFFEYSPDNLAWQIREAGLEVVSMEHHQLVNAGAHWWTHLGRVLCSPLLSIPRFRDGLVAVARKPSTWTRPRRSSLGSEPQGGDPLAV